MPDTPTDPVREDGLTRAIEAIRQDGMRDAERRIVEWLYENSHSCCHAGDHYAEAIERGEHRA